MACMMPKPPLDSDKIYELVSHGVDSVRALLANWVKNPIRLGNVDLTRREIEEWLKWKAAKDACWMKVGVVAAVVAAFFSLVAALK
jgi:aryl carrier-like protein